MPRTLEEVQNDIRALLFTTRKQRRAPALPESTKEVLREVCHIVWDHLADRGKLSLAMLVGSDFDVVGLDDDVRELENKLVNNVYVALDDPSGRTGKSPSLIKRATTGGKLQRRNLFITAGQLEMRYAADLSLKCVTCHFIPKRKRTGSFVSLLADERQATEVSTTY